MKQALRKYLKKSLRLIAAAFGFLFITSFFYAVYLRWFPPITTPLMVLRAFEPHKNDWSLTCRWRGSNEISDNVKIAVIASEDQNFSSHYGFDLTAIEKAYKHNRKSKRIRGASTISQQVAKNVFLWQGRSYIRKGFEVYFTLLIETLWSKERILTMYLNISEMGDGIFGVEAAAEKYWKKDAAHLTLQQGALLAAILPNPRKYSPVKPGPYIQRRQGRIQRNIRYLGKNYLDSL